MTEYFGSGFAHVRVQSFLDPPARLIMIKNYVGKVIQVSSEVLTGIDLW